MGECVFNSRANFTNECYQGFEVEVGAPENKKNVVNETFQKMHVFMHVCELQGAMFEDEIKNGRHYMQRWVVRGK